MKRETTESRIIQYFQDEELEKVQLLFGIVKGIISRRSPAKKRVVKSKPETKSNSGDSVRDALQGSSTSSVLKDKTESGYVNKSN